MPGFFPSGKIRCKRLVNFPYKGIAHQRAIPGPLVALGDGEDVFGLDVARGRAGILFGV